MWETYGKYIIWYVIIGFIYFLCHYRVTFKLIIEYNDYNKTSFTYEKIPADVKWNKLIWIKGVFWPIGFIMDIVKIISTIGV